MSLFNYLVDGVTYAKVEYEAHVRADQEAHEAEMEMAQMKMEWEAEQRNERFFEERGFEAAREQEDHEARMGVVSFHDAMREAEGVYA